jgi:hypothetical protein
MPKKNKETNQADRDSDLSAASGSRLFHIDEIKWKAKEVNEDQSTWRSGPRAIAALIKKLEESAK